MKKLLKPFTLLLAGLLMAGSMVACGGDADGDSDKLLTPEDVYKKVDKAEDIKMIMEMDITDMMTTTMTAEKDGDKAYTITEMEMMGMTQTVEVYTEKKGDTVVTYTKDGNEWIVDESDAEDTEDEASLNAFEELFKSENFEAFDLKSGKYVMKEDVTIEADSMTLSEAYIKINGNTFEIYAKISVSEAGMSMSGFLKIKIELTDTTVTLPEV